MYSVSIYYQFTYKNVLQTKFWAISSQMKRRIASFKRQRNSGMASIYFIFSVEDTISQGKFIYKVGFLQVN